MNVLPYRQGSPTSPISSPCKRRDRELLEADRHGQHLHGCRLQGRFAQLGLDGEPVSVAQPLVSARDGVFRHDEPGKLAQPRRRVGDLRRLTQHTAIDSSSTSGTSQPAYVP